MPRREKIDREAREWIIALLRREMATRNLSQADVARRMGVSQGTISNLLQNPVKGLGLDTVIRIHRTLRISGSELLGEPDWKQAAPPQRASLSAQPERPTHRAIRAQHPRPTARRGK